MTTPRSMIASAKNSMELVFHFAGWSYARGEKKATEFASHCKALCVVFDFPGSEERLLLVDDAEKRKQEL